MCCCSRKDLIVPPERNQLLSNLNSTEIKTPRGHTISPRPIVPSLSTLETLKKDNADRLDSSRKRYPEPLKTWTKDEQAILIEILEKNPKARRDAQSLGRLLERAHALLPAKSSQEIKECYSHVVNSRVAYFQAAVTPRSAA